MPKPSLDEIFSKPIAQEKPSLDEIFGGVKQAPIQGSDEAIAQRPDRFQIDAYKPGDNYGIGNAYLDALKLSANSAANLGENLMQPVLHPIKTLQGIGNAIIHPIDTASAAAGYAMSRYGSPEKAYTTLSTDPFGVAGDAATAYGLGKGAVGVAKGIPNLRPTVYSDIPQAPSPFFKTVVPAEIVKSAVAKIKAPLESIRNVYKGITDPFTENIVDGETFNKALSILPEAVRKDFIAKYGTEVTDNKGRPLTTVGRLYKMEQELQDEISPVKYGERLTANDYNIAEYKKKLKDIRLSLMPEESAKEIRKLDDKFGPLINASNELLPKLADRQGVPNTEFIYRVMKNPAKSGMRNYMAELKKVGIDITPEMKAAKGWVSSVERKRGIRSLTGHAVGGGTLGAVIKVATGH